MAFKMRGHSLPGPNQRKDGKSKKQIAYEMSEEHAGKPGFQEFLDKTFGGPTTIEGSVTHTKKDSPAKAYGHKSPAKKELIGDQKNLPEELKAKIEAAPGKMYGKKSPAKQTKFPNSPGAKKRKKKKFIKKVTKMMEKGRRDDWQPAFPGADHSKKELKKMTKKQKEDYYN